LPLAPRSANIAGRPRRTGDAVAMEAALRGKGRAMSIGIWQIALVGLVLLLLFSRKLPALGAELGRGVRDLRGHLAAKRTAEAEDAPFEDPAPGRKVGGR
jgi:hypothetical protein